MRDGCVAPAAGREEDVHARQCARSCDKQQQTHEAYHDTPATHADPLLRRECRLLGLIAQ